MPSRSLLLLPLLFLLAPACTDENTWDRLNEDTDCFDVVLSPDAGDDDDSAADDDDSAAGEDVAAIDLHAVPGYFDRDVIGAASLSPTSGPATTDFRLSVVLTDTRTEQGNPVSVVDRVSVLVDNGSVTLNEFELDPSPADEARWTIELGTGGDPTATRRTDRICVALYSEIQ